MPEVLVSALAISWMRYNRKETCMNISEIHFDQTDRCRVVGRTGRTYHSTPQAIGLALLGSSPAVEEATGGRLTWHDYLSTHGVAVGTRGDLQTHLAIIPPKPRTISLLSTSRETGRTTTESHTVTFPHVLMGLRLLRGRFEQSILMLPNMTQQGNMNVTSTVSLLTTFPYGNVYAGGRICWGGVSTADIHTIKDLEDLFFGSGFNSDLFDPASAGHAGMALTIANSPQGVLTPTLRNAYNISQVISTLLGGD
mgnify:FL=1